MTPRVSVLRVLRVFLVFLFSRKIYICSTATWGPLPAVRPTRGGRVPNQGRRLLRENVAYCCRFMFSVLRVLLFLVFIFSRKKNTYTHITYVTATWGRVVVERRAAKKSRSTRSTENGWHHTGKCNATARGACGWWRGGQRKSRSTRSTENGWHHTGKCDVTGRGACGWWRGEQRKSRSTRSTENGDMAGRHTTQPTPWRTTQLRPGAQPSYAALAHSPAGLAHNPATPWRTTQRGWRITRLRPGAQPSGAGAQPSYAALAHNPAGLAHNPAGLAQNLATPWRTTQRGWRTTLMMMS